MYPSLMSDSDKRVGEILAEQKSPQLLEVANRLKYIDKEPFDCLYAQIEGLAKFAENIKHNVDFPPQFGSVTKLSDQNPAHMEYDKHRNASLQVYARLQPQVEQLHDLFRQERALRHMRSAPDWMEELQQKLEAIIEEIHHPKPVISVEVTPTIVAKIIVEPLSRWQLFKRLFRRHPQVVDL